MLKSEFPIAVQTTETTAEVQFGQVKRPTHSNTSWDQARFESPMHRWVDMSEAGFGVAVLNDCKYGYDAKDTIIRLTMLRSPTYPWPESDQGDHRFRYGLLVHHGLTDVPAQAEEFNHPIEVIAGQGDVKPDDLTSVAVPAHAGIAVEAVKLAEKSDDVILRLVERSGVRCTAPIALAEKFTAAAITDLLEQEKQAVEINDHAVELSFGPFEIITLRLRREA